MPAVTLCSSPSGEPIATAVSPTSRSLTLPITAAGRSLRFDLDHGDVRLRVGADQLRRQLSPDASVTSIVRASSTTCAFVRMCPSERRMMPEPVPGTWTSTEQRLLPRAHVDVHDPRTCLRRDVGDRRAASLRRRRSATTTRSTVVVVLVGRGHPRHGERDGGGDDRADESAGDGCAHHRRAACLLSPASTRRDVPRLGVPICGSRSAVTRGARSSLVVAVAVAAATALVSRAGSASAGRCASDGARPRATGGRTARAAPGCPAQRYRSTGPDPRSGSVHGTENRTTPA